MLKCAVCGAVESKEKKLLQCGSCKSVAYCSADHQKQDWPSHKNSCSLISVQVQKVEIEGDKNEMKTFKTVVVASQDFQQGEILLDERPLFNIPFSHCCGSGPPPPANPMEQLLALMSLLGGESTTNRDLQCLTCGVIVGPEKGCSKCSAPICSRECQKAPLHAENECLVFASSRRSRPFGKHSGGEGNCLMKKVILNRIENVKRSHPEVWEAVKSLVGPNLEFTDDYKMLQWLMKKKGYYHFQPLVMMANDDGTNSFARISCLYKIGSQIEHSCSPNCTMTLGHFPDFKMRVRAAVPLKKGDIINISRLTNRPAGTEGTFFRRETILRHFNYICECKMCSDVTELGSFQSAVACTKCRDSPAGRGNQKQVKEGEGAKEAEKESEGKLPGYLLPVNSSPGAKWKCGGCGMEKSELEIITFIQNLKQETETKMRLDFEAVYSGKILHPNHFIILLFKQSMMTKSLQEGINADYVEASKYVLQVLDKIAPGLSSQRAGLERHLSLSLLQILEDNPLPKSMPAGQIRKLMKMVKECDEYQRKSLVFYQNHPPDRGAKVYNVALLLLQEMEQLKAVERKIKRRYNIRQ